MKIKVIKKGLKEIQAFRTLFLHEANLQFIHNAFHERGWADCYLVTVDELNVGYGAVCGRGNWQTERSTLFEFYLIPSYRKMASLIIPELLRVSGVSLIECQSNDLLLTSMLFEFSKHINAGVILFEDHTATQYTIPAVIFRARKEDDIIFEHKVEGVGEYVLEIKGEIVATGGFLLHYNLPYSDLYMEVKEDCRNKGFGSFILQELKIESYRAGRKPAARCNITNKASKATLLKAGLKVCGYILTGEVKN
ncbi:MAG: family N-acetyltransferase [Chitinophagaceae bacterium]|nr:family N-acetyltransferase [Chitinophagaceae bacterium]